MDFIEPFYKDSSRILDSDNEDNEKGHLFIGNIKSAQPYSLGPKKIKSVLTVTNESKVIYNDPNIIHKKLNVVDEDDQNLLQYFDECYNFIENNLKNGNVLVHCMAGVSRSATIIIAYLMKKKKLTFQEAFEFVKIRRVIIWPNDGFIEQLKKYEEILKEQQ